MEELSEQCGRSCWNGEVQILSRRRSSLGSGPGEGLRAREPPCGVGLGDALRFPKEDLASAVRLFCEP